MPPGSVFEETPELVEGHIKLTFFYWKRKENVFCCETSNLRCNYSAFLAFHLILYLNRSVVVVFFYYRCFGGYFNVIFITKSCGITRL